MGSASFFGSISDPTSQITPIPSGEMFPDLIEKRVQKYKSDINIYQELILSSNSTGELLASIRKQGKFNAQTRMSLLKLFRRTACVVCDTEATKKISKIDTQVFIDHYGHTFKPIHKLQEQFGELNDTLITTLCVLLGEYDGRGQQGYVLTGIFFNWFEERFPDMTIEGPRGAGKDIQLCDVFPEFEGDYPCDFIICDQYEKVLAVGFARYDSTRGGAQSDDRTGGNANKISKAELLEQEYGHNFRMIFLADGPGLIHKDTWKEACDIDGLWNGNVRVTTLKLNSERISRDWLEGV